MSLSTELFENAPVGIDGVIRQVIQIFGEHWQPLVLMISTGIQMIAFTGVFLVLGTLTRLLAASYILYLVSVLLQTMITPFYYDYDHHDRNYYGDDQQ
jgi:type IV secretory pathway TrbL component